MNNARKDKTIAMQRGAKERRCANCGCDMRGRQAAPNPYRSRHKKVLCRECSGAGWGISPGGLVSNFYHRREAWLWKRTINLIILLG